MHSTCLSNALELFKYKMIEKEMRSFCPFFFFNLFFIVSVVLCFCYLSFSFQAVKFLFYNIFGHIGTALSYNIVFVVKTSTHFLKFY
jgi:hypothetical protein